MPEALVCLKEKFYVYEMTVSHLDLDAGGSFLLACEWFLAVWLYRCRYT